MLLRQLATLAALAVLTSTGAVVATAPAHSISASSASSSAAAEDDGYGRMILLLDSSGSMAEPAGGGQTKIAAARSALKTVVQGLPDEAQVGLRVFGAKVFSRNDPGSCTDSQLVVEPGTDNRDQLADAIDDYEPYGETPIPHALEEAAKDLGDEGARSIVLVSDGESTCDPDPCKVAATLQGNGIDLQIDVVGLSVSGEARRQLQCIAENGNGTYYDANDAADIESRLTRVAERAIRPFTLTGQPIDGGPEDAPTPVTVGEYVDTLEPRGSSKSYLFERTTAGTTLRVAAVT
ncbi:MAG TPA: VWA domain-containing protein, partial [Nocardioides sp.]|nr:VWA domain-containing protein [Nocardioides sp.]